MAGSQGSATYQSTDNQCLSTVYRPLPKPLISVLGYSLPNDELGDIAEVAYSVAVRPHGGEHRRFRLPLLFRGQLRGGYVP